MRRRWKQIIIGATVLSLTAALASFLPWRFWPFEIAASFRVQAVSICLVSAGAALLLRMRIWATLGAVVALAQIGLLVPHFVSAHGGDSGAGPDTRLGREVTVLTLNLNHANRNARGVIEMIRREKPDIVALQEASHWWHEQLRSLGDEYPFRTFDRLTPRSGVGVLSRIEPAAEEWRCFDGRAFVELTFEEKNLSFRFTALHTLPPKTPFTYAARNRQLDRTALWIAGEGAGPAIAAGDMNSTPWSPVLRDFERTTGLTSVREGHGTLPTWPSWGMWIGVPIDHIFHSDHFRTEYVLPVKIPGSDHRALLARLRRVTETKERVPSLPSLL
ncbi:MAG: endonuclease/exonuclease/phosphatase family protein [Candidatus Eisenbacteria bacterium]|nr:endonuclease/exonuclease/phosphatase family protein [Candidatus Eisenbacteria bacterium]